MSIDSFTRGRSVCLLNSMARFFQEDEIIVVFQDLVLIHDAVHDLLEVLARSSETVDVPFTILIRSKARPWPDSYDVSNHNMPDLCGDAIGKLDGHTRGGASGNLAVVLLEFWKEHDRSAVRHAVAETPSCN